MARPKPGGFYTVQDGDTFEKIALRAYGIQEKSYLIKRANQLITRSQTVEIVSGEQIFIPFDPGFIEIKQA